LDKSLNTAVARAVVAARDIPVTVFVTLRAAPRGFAGCAIPDRAIDVRFESVAARISPVAPVRRDCTVMREDVPARVRDSPIARRVSAPTVAVLDNTLVSDFTSVLVDRARGFCALSATATIITAIAHPAKIPILPIKIYSPLRDYRKNHEF
jgi:hypothetical protein